jgi:hypothetical protein
VLEMGHEGRAARRAIPGVQGHSRHCCCLKCEELRDLILHRSNPPHRQTTRAAAAAAANLPGHSSGCQCASCLERSLTEAIPPHGPSCQCLDCLKAREFAEASVGMPGHPPTCHQRALPQSAATHFPDVPGVSRPTPRIPTPHSPHQPNMSQPRRVGISGF